MEFFKSRHAKLFLIVIIVMGAMVYGVLKQLESKTPSKAKRPVATKPDKPASETEQSTEQQTEKQAELNKQKREEEQRINSYNPNFDKSPEGKLIRDGLSAMEKGNLKGAIRNLKLASESEREDVQRVALRNLGNCYLRLGDSDSVVESYEKLVKIENDQNIKKETYEKLGTTYTYNNQYGKALDAYKKSYEIKQTIGSALKICDIYDKSHNTKALKEHIEKHIKEHPDQKYMFNKYAQFMSDSEVWNSKVPYHLIEKVNKNNAKNLTPEPSKN